MVYFLLCFAIFTEVEIPEGWTCFNEYNAHILFFVLSGKLYRMGDRTAFQKIYFYGEQGKKVDKSRFFGGTVSSALRIRSMYHVCARGA